MLNKKRGQLSDAMTWIVATIVIVVLLLAFVYSSDLLGKANSIKSNAKEILINDSSEENIDLFEQKTLFAYNLNSKNKDDIESWRKNEIE